MANGNIQPSHTPEYRRKRYAENAEVRARAQAVNRKSRAKQLADPEKREKIRGQVRAGQARYRAKTYVPHPKPPAMTEDEKRDKAYRKQYGVSLEWYTQTLESQGGVCAICKGPQLSRWTNFHVDHCHATGEARGLLCHQCNVGIGMLKDDPATIAAALEYLTR